MTTAELLSRYDNHPLGTTIKHLENSGDYAVLHRYYIAAKTMILLLEYQKELSKAEADALEKHVQDRVDLLVKPAAARKAAH